MRNQSEPEKAVWLIEFENLYIVTYQKLYRHAKLIFNQEEKIRELLILTYMEAYQRGEQLQKEKSPIDWLIKREDFLAETKLDASREMLEASHAEEKMQKRSVSPIWMRHLFCWKLRTDLELWMTRRFRNV